MADEPSRAELRSDLLFREEAYSVAEFLRAYGPVGCDAAWIADRVMPFLADGTDLAMLEKQTPKPSVTDLDAFLVAVCEEARLYIAGLCNSEITFQEGKTYREMIEIEQMAVSPSFADGLWFNSQRVLRPIRDVIDAGNRLYPVDFKTCPMPAGTALNADETLSAIARILGWTTSRNTVHAHSVQVQNDRAQDDEMLFSEDYRSVVWRGETFTFTTNQAACMQRLHDAWRSGKPVLSQISITEAIDDEARALRDVFRTGGKTHPAWNKLIVSIEGNRGLYRLSPDVPA